MEIKFLLFFFLVCLHCYPQADTVIAEQFVQKKTADYAYKGEIYAFKTKSIGYFIVEDGKRLYTYDTLCEFMLEKGNTIKYIALTPQNKIAMQGQFKIVMIGQTKSMQKTGKWKYYDRFGKLILVRKEKFKKTNKGSTHRE